MQSCEVAATIQTGHGKTCSTVGAIYWCNAKQRGEDWAKILFFYLRPYDSTINSSVDRVTGLSAERSIFDLRQGKEVLLLLFFFFFSSFLLFFFSSLLFFSFSSFLSFLSSLLLLLFSFFSSLLFFFSSFLLLFSKPSWPIMRTSQSFLRG